MPVAAKDYDIDVPITWCPGCGNFPLLRSLKAALASLNIAPHETAFFTGIGQAGKTGHYLKCNYFNGLHGRTLPMAFAAGTVTDRLTIIAEGGDGDMYGEGGNHFLHTLRRNPHMTMISHNNQTFGLTQGQASPTTEEGVKTKVQTHGVILKPVNPVGMAVLYEAPFVARGFTGDMAHLTGLIAEAIRTEGFALVDVLQPCPSFDKVHTFQYYKERVYKLDEDSHDPRDAAAALEKSKEWGNRIPIGVFYRNPNRPTYQARSPVIREKYLLDRAYDPAKVDKAIESFF